MTRKSLLGSVSFLAIAATSLPTVSGLAQEQDQADNALDQIIVTARKREESLFEVPLSITAFSGRDIAEAGITDVQDLALHTPGFSYREGFGRLSGNSNNRPSIRGMSSILGEPNAAFFVDGVYVSGPITGYSLDNLARVEVVRGPQSALFGRGTFGGAINFITRRPSLTEVEGEVFGKVAQHSNYEFRARVAGPLVQDKLSIELNARHYEFGGDYFNDATGKTDLSEEQTQQVGGKINFQPSEDLSVYIDMAYTQDRDGGFSYGQWNGGNDDETVLDPNRSNCFSPTITDVPFFGGLFTLPFNLENRSRGYFCGELDSFDNYYYDLDGNLGVDRDQFRLSAIIDYSLGEWTLSSITGFTDIDSETNVGATNPTGSISRSITGEKYFSEELRLASPAEGTIHGLVGAYYFKETAGNTFDENYNPLTADQTSGVSSSDFLQDDSELKNYAVFGTVDADITEKLNVSVEARYQEEKIILAGENQDDPLTAEAGDDPGGLKFTAFLPRAAVRYTIDGDWNVYASVARGNKPGGFNEAFYDITRTVGEREAFVNDGKGQFEESKVWSYEAGVKGAADEGRFRFSAAAFYLDWSKQPLSDSDALSAEGNPTSQSTIVLIQNAGKSKVNGLEFETSYSPTEYVSFGFNYAWANARFKDYRDENFRDLQDTNGFFTGPAVPSKVVDVNNDGELDNAPGVFITGTAPDGRILLEDTVDPDGQVRGNSLPQTPKHQFNISTTLRKPLTDSVTGFLRADFLYESKRFVQAANLAFVGASENLNMRFGIEGESYTITFFVDNLTQNDTPEVGTRIADFRDFFFIPSQVRLSNNGRFTFLRDFFVTAPRKRQFGIEASYKF